MLGSIYYSDDYRAPAVHVPHRNYLGRARDSSTDGDCRCFVQGQLVEIVLREVDKGLVESGQAMAAATWLGTCFILLPEARPTLIAAGTVTAIALIDYTAMAGVIGGGGLGDLAMRYGYQRFQNDVMVVTMALLVLLVQVLQFSGDRLVLHYTRRR